MVAPNSHHLQSRVNLIYDHLYANAPTRTPAGISAEVGKVLHSGMYLEECKKKHPAFNFDRFQMQALLTQDSVICGDIAKTLRGAFAEMNKAWKFYEPTSEIILNDLSIAYTALQLNGLYLSDPKRDVFGDVIEIIRSNWAKRIGGQFFTDQRVTALAMTLLNFDPRKGDDLVDICSGTGGFLLAGLNHIRELLEKDAKGKPVEETLIQLSLTGIKGLEVDEEIAGLANASLKARLGTKHKAFVSNCDSLNPITFDKNNAGIKYGKHLCAASNPPFGTKITIKDPAILQAFSLSNKQSRHNFSLSGLGKITPRAPDILFLEQNINLLVPGRGRLAIVLPYQILSGPQTLFVREWLLCHTQILAVIDLPNETFQPHTGTKTSLLLVKRRERPLSNSRDDSEGTVFMGMPRWIGHDRRGHPIFKRNVDGSASEEILSDFNEVKAAYRTFLEGGDPRETHEQCFTVPYSTIVKDDLLRMNALFHKPFNEEDGTASDVPSVLKPGWTTVKLRDVVDRIFYPGRFRRDYVDRSSTTVPFLGGSNITELLATTEKWLSPDDPKLGALKVKAGWVLITRSGSTGIISFVPPAWDGFAMSEHVIRIVPNPAKLDPYYLLAFLRTNYAQEIIKRGVFGSVIDEITPDFIGEIEVPLPKSKKDMKEIAAKVQDAEEARQEAIEGYSFALDQLDRQLGRSAVS